MIFRVYLLEWKATNVGSAWQIAIHLMKFNYVKTDSLRNVLNRIYLKRNVNKSGTDCIQIVLLNGRVVSLLKDQSGWIGWRADACWCFTRVQPISVSFSRLACPRFARLANAFDRVHGSLSNSVLLSFFLCRLSRYRRGAILACARRCPSHKFKY